MVSIASALQHRIVRLLEAEARAGRPCPTNEAIADLLGRAERSEVQGAMRRAAEAGLIVVRYSHGGTRRVVSAPDGSWATAEPRRQAKLARRTCLRCRELFHPEHAGRFCCDPCFEANSRVWLPA